MPPLASDAERSTWIEAGIKNPKAVEVLFHARDSHARGASPDDNPFDAASHGKAHERWQWMFCCAVKREADNRPIDLFGYEGFDL